MAINGIAGNYISLGREARKKTFLEDLGSQSRLCRSELLFQRYNVNVMILVDETR